MAIALYMTICELCFKIQSVSQNPKFLLHMNNSNKLLFMEMEHVSEVSEVPMQDHNATLVSPLIGDYKYHFFDVDWADSNAKEKVKKKVRKHKHWRSKKRKKKKVKKKSSKSGKNKHWRSKKKSRKSKKRKKRHGKPSASS
jgi:hypothetical protein